MRLLKFSEEVKFLYLDQFNMMNKFVNAWINTSLNLELRKDELYITSNVLKSLFALLNINPLKHLLGYVKVNFDENSATVTTKAQSEQIIVKLDPIITLKLAFVFTWYSKSSIITKRVYDKLKINGGSGAISPLYYEVSYKDLDLSKLGISNIIQSADDLVQEVARLWNMTWSYKELSSILDIISLIHASLLELRDTRNLLELSIAHDIKEFPLVSLVWSMVMIPDVLLFSCKIDPQFNDIDSLDKLYIKDGRVYVPQFTLMLDIIRN